MKRNATRAELPWVGYTRVSTSEQSISGLGLESQEAKIRAMATVKGVELSEIITDAGESAKSLDRPGVQRLMEMIRGREIAGIIIAKIDRLSRSVRDYGELIDLLNRYDVAIASTAEQMDTSTAGGRMVLNVVIAFSQFEREVICERTKDALQAKLRRGEACGNPAYGYKRAPDGQAVPVEEEMIVLNLARMWREEGASLRDIAKRLNEEGYRTRGAGTVKRGKVSSGLWAVQYVHKTLLGL